ncbi:MAG: Ig-like domain-containing protein, partial [Candidatus Eisenbacteria bacterium]|nr:Ig-like domain-containing protein [Candidatus Eisenbacteria bacterium]
VTATTIGGTVEGQVSFITSGPPTSVTFVSPWPPVNLIADGESEIDLMVEVLDINDNFVLGGTSVEFRTDIGTVGGTGTTADGCGGSIATDTYKSEVLDGDYSYSIPDNGIGAIATVTAKAGLGGWAAAYLNINLLTSSANKDASNLDIDTDVAAGSMNSFSVKIRDRFGNPLGGHSLAFTATDGTVTPGTAVTDMWGEASGLFTAPNDSTSVTLQVQDNDPNYGGIVFTEGITVQ